MGCMDRASLERMLSQGLSLSDIGRRVGRHEATVAYWIKKYGLVAAGREKYASRGGL
jgi:IS30 family transposase